MSERDRGDRPKKSWRELDNQRDRAGARPAARSGDGGNRTQKDGMDARASKQYRAALDALFEKGEVGKLAEKMSGGPGASRIDPQDLVRGTHRGGGSDAPSMSGAGSSKSGGSGSPFAGSSGSSSSSSTERETPARAAAPAAPAAPPKEDGRAALRKKVIEALGRDEISRAIDRYVKAHGWPNDFEILEQALEHTKFGRQTEAMTQLEQLLTREKPKRSRTLAGKLRLIEETSDGDLRDQAARVRAKL
ncbi:MAG: hypothetical protein JWN44_1622 [Myxococcales bacterium]|nr:hypothetical protein [Myxococcales bacterium]